MDSDISIEASRYLPLAKSIAASIKELAPEAGTSHLVNLATAGLADAFNQFRPRQGLTLRTYLIYRIQLAIYNGLSTHQWPDELSRQRYVFQKKSNDLLLHFHLSAEGSVKRSTRAEQDEICYLLRMLSIVALLARASIPDAIQKLDKRDQHFVSCYYDKDIGMEETAAKLGLYPSAANRLHVRILETLAGLVQNA